MKNNNLVKGLPKLEEELLACVACQYGKQTRLPFPKNQGLEGYTEAIDVGEPESTPSSNGSKFYIAFIDDYMRMC